MKIGEVVGDRVCCWGVYRVHDKRRRDFRRQSISPPKQLLLPSGLVQVYPQGVPIQAI
jgi:hypothetical protein